MAGKFINRFTGRGKVYSKYRPSYPKEILEILEKKIGFDRSKIVADIGSGTGLLSKIFLEYGNKVYGVEPNEEMRSFAETDLSSYPNFVSVNGSAENTGLEEESVDLITAGQALHWFDRVEAPREFARILKAPAGYVLIVYNEREKEEQGLMYGYQKMIERYSTSAEVPEIDNEYLSKFFSDSGYEKFFLPNEQLLDYDGLLGRAASASYLPSEGQVGFEEMKQYLLDLFNKYEQNGIVRMRYSTTMFLGKIRT